MSKLAKNQKNGNDVIICWHDTFVKFFDQVFFLLSSLVTGPSFMSISSLVMDWWQFSFIRDSPEIRKLEIPPLEFCPISGDWGELGISNLPLMCLVKCYWILQNARVTAFIVFELVKSPLPSPSRFGLKMRMAVSVEVSIVVWSQYITLELFWRTLENDTVTGFTPFTKHFTKIL